MNIAGWTGRLYKTRQRIKDAGIQQKRSRNGRMAFKIEHTFTSCSAHQAMLVESQAARPVLPRKRPGSIDVNEFKKSRKKQLEVYISWRNKVLKAERIQSTRTEPHQWQIVHEVRLTGLDGEHLELLVWKRPYIFEEAGADLAEISPTPSRRSVVLWTTAPLYGALKEQKKKQKAIQVKEVKFRPGTDDMTIRSNYATWSVFGRLR